MQENKANLSKELEDVIKSIKDNSKDADFADSLISELLSLKGQIDHEPTIVNLPLSKVADKMDGDTFAMYVMRDGTAVYHVKGGMDIVCKPTLFSLNQTIVSLIEDYRSRESMSEEEKSAFDTELQASAYVMNIPMIAFSDIDFMFDSASSVIQFLKKQYEEGMNAPLKEETIVEDAEFKDAVVAAESMKKQMEIAGHED